MENNWVSTGEYNSHGISAKVYKSENAKVNEQFDLGIFFGTFESRGLTGSSLLKEKSCKYSFIIYFNEAKDTELRVKYDTQLKQQVESCTINKVKVIDNVSIKDIEDILFKLTSQIPNNCFQFGSKWFYDLGGSPIPYFLGLIAHVRNGFPRPQITLFNPTGDYDTGNFGYDFTSGFDKNIWVPYLWGNVNPNLPRMYVFLLGFDGERSYDILNKCEPDMIKVVIAKPGYKKIYEDLVITRNQGFLRESGIMIGDNLDKENVFELDASNLIDTWQVLDQLYEEINNRANLVFVPLGTRGQALGCGLCSLSNQKPSVLYHIPQTWIVKNVNRGSVLWKYDLIL